MSTTNCKIFAVCVGTAGWSISKQALEVDELKQAADLANERAAQASGAQQLRQVRLLYLSLPLL
jgi:hypothetical protein